MAAQCCSRRLAARPCSPLAGAQEGGAATPFLNQWRRLASYMLPEDIAKGIALDAQANLGGLDVISVGRMWADDHGNMELTPCCPCATGRALRPISSRSLRIKMRSSPKSIARP
jgi:hypothetical protein